MNFRDIVNTASSSTRAESFFSRILGRFTGSMMMSIIITLFTVGILAVVFLYVVFVLLKSL
ncbi:MAG TPA: hypothetical protein VJ455_05920 [Ignavibacteria bacterium]|nr:hypothetical protein [Ignavibacteria bacterium]